VSILCSAITLLKANYNVLVLLLNARQREVPAHEQQRSAMARCDSAVRVNWRRLRVQQMQPHCRRIGTAANSVQLSRSTGKWSQSTGRRCWRRRALLVQVEVRLVAAVSKFDGCYRLILFSPGLLAMLTQHLPPTLVLDALDYPAIDHAWSSSLSTLRQRQLLQHSCSYTVTCRSSPSKLVVTALLQPVDFRWEQSERIRFVFRPFSVRKVIVNQFNATVNAGYKLHDTTVLSITSNNVRCLWYYMVWSVEGHSSPEMMGLMILHVLTGAFI